MIGFLDLNGIFYPCKNYEHIEKAQQICNKLHYVINLYEISEDVLLKNGFICIRAKDAYKSTYDNSGNVLFLSQAQQTFINKNWNNFNDQQKNSLYNILRDFGKAVYE